MPEFATRLYLVTPPLGDAGLLPQIEAAVDAGDVACLFLRLEPLPERGAKDLIKRIGAAVQRRGVALLVADPRLAAHAGADGVHVDMDLASAALESLKPERIVGVGGLATRDDAMRAGEAGVDYVMFGGDGSGEPQDILERVGWWAEIFNVPCVGFAQSLSEVEVLAAMGAEFVALGNAVWNNPAGAAEAVAVAQASLALGQAGERL